MKNTGYMQPTGPEQQAAWLKRWSDIHPESRPAGLDGELTDRTAGGQPETLFDAAAEALNAPTVVILSRGAQTGMQVTVDAPTVADCKRFMAALRGISGANLPTNADELKNAMGVLPGIQELFLGSLEFAQGEEPEDRGEWFDSLKLPDAMDLVETWTRVVDLGELIRRMQRLVGNLRGVAGIGRKAQGRKP